MSDEYNDIVINTTFRQKKVTVEEAVKDATGKIVFEDDGTTPKIKKRRFIMREMDGAARDTVLTLQAQKSHVDGNGFRVVDDFTGQCSCMLSRMLFEVNNIDGVDVVSKTGLPEAEIQSWPTHQQVLLHNAAQKLCGMDETAVADAKKD